MNPGRGDCAPERPKKLVNITQRSSSRASSAITSLGENPRLGLALNTKRQSRSHSSDSGLISASFCNSSTSW
ncbi:Uncharacterised protein [Vibrio cholerae]|nr:Uncharacterised protein [Vibrio cholerae]